VARADGGLLLPVIFLVGGSFLLQVRSYPKVKKAAAGSRLGVEAPSSL
jgi:hypothetical protein